MVQHAIALGQLVQLVLREIANADSLRRDALARHEREAFGDGFDQRGLTLSVCADCTTPFHFPPPADKLAPPMLELKDADLGYGEGPSA